MKVKEAFSNDFKAPTLHTQFGTAKISPYGYYVITSKKEGNSNKRLNRLVFEDFYGINLDEEFPNGIHIHHIDGDKTNNAIWNLEPLTPTEHLKLHKTGKCLLDNHKVNISKSTNTTGYFRVSKDKTNSCKQGFIWKYSFIENGKSKSLKSVDIQKLKEKVLAKGWEWIEYGGDFDDSVTF